MDQRHRATSRLRSFGGGGHTNHQITSSIIEHLRKRLRHNRFHDARVVVLQGIRAFIHAHHIRSTLPLERSKKQKTGHTLVKEGIAAKEGKGSATRYHLLQDPTLG